MTERVGFQQSKAFVGSADGEMRQVVNNEHEHNQAADDHVARCEGRFDMLPFDIVVRASTPVIDGKPNSKINVQADRDEKDDSDQPYQRAKLGQMSAVSVDPAWYEKNL